MHIIGEGTILNTDLCLGVVESMATQLLTSVSNGDDDKTEPVEAQRTPSPPPPHLAAKAKPEVAPKPKVRI